MGLTTSEKTGLDEFVDSRGGEDKGDGSIIAFLMSHISYNRTLEDEVGIFALVTEMTVTVGKSYVFKDIVSCHVRAVYAADNTDRDLVMYIQQDDQFLKFKPRKIIESDKSYINHKGSAKMYNFPVEMGEKLSASLRE